MGDPARGLYHKFDVERTDGSSLPGGKHVGCDYFILDLTHDKHAYAALRGYIDSCRSEYPMLADDLTEKCRQNADEEMALMLSHLVEKRMRSAIKFAHDMESHINEFREQAPKNRALDMPNTTGSRNGNQ